MTLAWGNKLTEAKLTVKNIYGKTVQIEEGHKIKINRIGLSLVGEDFLREANFKANRRDFNRRGTEVYVGVCTFGNKENIQGWRRMRSRILKPISTKKVIQRKARQST